jgi:hypothetical protein
MNDQARVAKNVIRLVGLVLLSFVANHFFGFWGSLGVLGWFWSKD